MLEPLGNKVLVKVGAIEEKVGSIIMTAETTAKEQLAKCSGVVVSIGPLAFKSFGDGNPWVNVNDRIYFQKYGGIQHKETIDGVTTDYRIINDDDVVALIRD